MSALVAEFVQADAREHSRARYLVQRGRVLLRRELAAHDDVLRLAADTGEHRAAFQHLYATARADGYAARQAVATALYALAHIDGCVVRATHAQIAERAALTAPRPVSAASVEKYLREFRANTLLRTLEGGLSAEANAKRGGEGPRVPLYALVVPVALDHLLPARTPLHKGRDARAREAALGHRVRKALGIREAVEELSDLERPAVFPGEASPATGPDDSVEGFDRCGPVDELSDPNPSRREEFVFPRPRPSSDTAGPVTAPRSRRGDAAAPRNPSPAQRVADELTGHVVLRKISSERRTRLVRRFANADWSANDVLVALEQQPDGTRHISTDAVKYPLSWAQYRLGFWLAGDGTPMPSRFQQLAEAAGHPDARRPAADPTEPTWEHEQRAGRPRPEPTNSEFRAARARLAQDQETRHAFGEILRAERERAGLEHSTGYPFLATIDAAFENQRQADDHQDLARRLDQYHSPILTARAEKRHATHWGALYRARMDHQGLQGGMPTDAALDVPGGFHDPAPFIGLGRTDSEHLIGTDPDWPDTDPTTPF